MSRPARKEADDAELGNDNLPARYEVGYGKPPAEHRFRNGTSGNPNGRPRGAKNKPEPVDPAHQPTDRRILEEAYRPVTIREGDKVIELPAIQAAVRSLAIAAMKGSRLSQRALAELVRQIEDRKANEHFAAMEQVFEYKQRWSAELERQCRYGSDEPDPIPHPEDLIIDPRTGHVYTEGPLDERGKGRWDERLDRRAQAQAEVNQFADGIAKPGHPSARLYGWRSGTSSSGSSTSSTTACLRATRPSSRTAPGAKVHRARARPCRPS